jgi:putative glutamine amidotransferase
VIGPVIGITLGPDSNDGRAYRLREDYVRSVERAGGLPLVLAPARPEAAPALLARLDGLLLSGGSDIDPGLYGAPSHPKVTQVIRARDEFELALAREALERDRPLLAICRGHQVLNVATGGTLVQDIPSEVRGGVDHDPDVERWETAHDVHVLPGTKLRAILGRDEVAVNSFHHQSVAVLGQGLVLSARSPLDGVVEGIEAPACRFALGVQWHPEGFWRDDVGFHALFAALTEAARA